VRCEASTQQKSSKQTRLARSAAPSPIDQSAGSFNKKMISNFLAHSPVLDRSSFICHHFSAPSPQKAVFSAKIDRAREVFLARVPEKVMCPHVLYLTRRSLLGHQAQSGVLELASTLYTHGSSQGMCARVKFMIAAENLRVCGTRSGQ
jgi:hypothetical protein